ncbi:hypothetical protein FRC09_010899 [Ceratobasidium sp. 395]|nr:hypothetical protein FRC09_010899 [Ceratobasidium sp. 395]
MSPKFKNIKVFEKLLKPVKRFWRILFPTSSTSSVNQTEEPAINPNPTDVPAAQLPDNDVSRSAPSGAALGFSRKLATGVATASKQPALNPNSTDIPAAQLPDNEAPRSAPPDTALGFSGKVVTGATTATKQPTLNLNPADVPAAQLPDNEAPRSAPSDNALGFSGKVAAGRITTTKQSGHTERPIVAQTPDTFEPTPKQQAAPFTRNVADQVWGGLKAFAGVLSSCGAEFGPLKAAIDVLVVSVSTFEAKRVTQQEYNSLRDTLDWYFHDLAARFGETIPSGMRPSIVNLARGLEHEIEFVRRKQNRHTGEGYAQAEEDLDEIMKCYRRIQNLLERLALNANVNVWMLMDEQATNYRLDKLTPSHAAWYNSKESKDIHRDECTPDTRIEVLERFKVWRDDNAVPKIYWLNGMAGTGKTTLSYTLCKQLVAENRLAANFFCSRLYETCRDAQLILPTIAYQLANFSYPFRYALSQILDRHPDVHTREMKEQFENLLLTPLREIQLSFPENLIIVIEALDECKNPAAVGELLDLLLSHMGDLPIKFFLTSRPEPEIRQRMCQRSGERERFELHLHDLDKSLVQDDIRRYLEVGLKRAKISPEDLQTLVERAGNLFIYAATIVRFVGDFEFSRSFKRLQQVLGAPTLSKGSDTEMNGLYSLILDHAINDPRLEKEEKDEMELVLRTVICALEPMTANALSTLLGLSRDSVDVAVGPLRSVLNFQQADEGISALHKSFSDYLFNPDRAGAFYCDAAKHNQVIAQYCFRLIKTSQPSFNICRLKSSFVFDKDVSHMSETVKQHISGGLLYVCRYWGAHAELAEDSQHFLDDVYDVLSERLLLWMEVLNLTGYLQPGGVDLLSRVTELIKVCEKKYLK